MNQTLEDIYKAGLKFLEPLTPVETYATIVEEAIKLVGADYGSILLENNKGLEKVYASDTQLYNIKVRKRGFTYKAFRAKHPSIINASQVKLYHPELHSLHVKSIIYIPLEYGSKTIGILSLDSKQKETFTDFELNSLKLFGSLASLAIKKTQHYNETQQALELRDYFISAAAHELRTPLTSIHGYTQLLHNRLNKKDSIEKRWVEQLLNETNRLTYLINELLEVNRIRSGKADYQWNECSMDEIIQRLINRIQYHYPNHIIEYKNDTLNENDSIIGDSDRLQQAIYNILENAAEYSNPSSLIKVHLSGNKQYVVLKIKDKGKGMDTDHLYKIFNGHLQNGIEDQEKGIGIGLFLVKNILTRHHALFDVKSKLNKGTTFVIKLPKYKQLSRKRL